MASITVILFTIVYRPSRPYISSFSIYPSWKPSVELMRRHWLHINIGILIYDYKKQMNFLHMPKEKRKRRFHFIKTNIIFIVCVYMCTHVCTRISHELYEKLLWPINDSKAIFCEIWKNEKALWLQWLWSYISNDLKV